MDKKEKEILNYIESTVETIIDNYIQNNHSFNLDNAFKNFIKTLSNKMEETFQHYRGQEYTKGFMDGVKEANKQWLKNTKLTD